MYHRYLVHTRTLNHKECRHWVEQPFQLNLQLLVLAFMDFILPTIEQMKLTEYPNTFRHLNSLHKGLFY